MGKGPWIALIGTLDTKGDEIAYTRDRLRALGAQPIVIDTGILGEPAGIAPDISHAEVASAAGDTLDGVRGAGSRGAAVERMLAGVRAICLRLFGEGRLDGALCLGGAEGGLMGAGAMHALPVGVPKLIVTPSASGRREFAPFMGETDTMVMHSVVDILGLHPISRAIFDNAAAAVVGMARDGGGAVGDLGERTVGVTMLGQTTPGVMRLRERLLEAGHAPVIFHANGVGGPAMEKLAASGALAGVVDYTLSELANSLMDGVHTTGPDRLRVAGRHGLPQVIVPGCCDFFNQGARDTVPERFRDRKSYFHNPVATLVRLSEAEGVELGRLVADRLAASTGPVAVVVPTRGFSLADAEGGDLYDPAADRAFIDALRDALRVDFAYEEVDAHVDDPAFADLVADRYLTLVKEPAHAG
jgi:uncharacterized protein (UPF0261 family)